ncbi:MAG TPA: chromate transporter, partial [Acetobacteraceae bacterium]|nr:chromate transporter [Acetobacteraceae bacterium]
MIVRIGLTSFGGGVSAWMMRVVVHERGWIGEGEFLSGLALCQVFPGINVLNLAIWLGYRLHGGAGAVAGALAMIVPPGLVLIGLGSAFAGLSQYPAARTALGGVAAAAVGFSGAMGVRATRRSVTGVVPGLVV